MIAGLLPGQDSEDRFVDASTNGPLELKLESDEPESEIKATATSLSIFIHKKLVLRAGVSYEN